MSQELIIEEVKRQAKHYSTLGKDKPEDHEYNVLARGLFNLAKSQSGHTLRQRVYTCRTLFDNGDDATIINMKRYGYTLDQAEKTCGCLTDCGAVAFDLIMGPAEETLSAGEVKERLGE